MASSIPVIAIDGPTASGKGTVSQQVAQRLGFHYLDSGALYRLAALCALRAGVDLTDGAAVAALAQGMKIRFVGDQVLLGSEDVSHAIRAEEVGNSASRIAAHPALRRALVDLQLGFRCAPGLVADGRDMGTVIFPDAGLKVFLTASVEARAQRRYKQLIEKGIPANILDLLNDLNERDARDSNRSASPLRPAEGAHLLDTSNLSVEQAVAQVLGWYASQCARQ